MAILTGQSFEFISNGADQTRRLGMRLGAMAKPGMLICLQGDLGAGKTTFVQGFAAGWGSLDQVSSPTFQLVNEYRKGSNQFLFHIDSYRIANLVEAEELDLDDMLEKGCIVMEWPEMVQDILPAERMWIRIQYLDETKRMFTFSATGDEPNALLGAYRKQIKGYLDVVGS